eukprot:Sdes_comp9258_c0_seq1m736
MSGRGGRGFRGGSRGGGRGGFRGGRPSEPQGPPESVVELGVYSHPCESDMICNSTNSMIPYFNAPVYLENKSQIGKVDEIFGPMTDVMFSVKLSPGMVASSFSKSQKVFVAPEKLLPLSRFLPKP